jgi:hypothetical protein
MIVAQLDYYLSRGKEVVNDYPYFKKITKTASNSLAKNINIPNPQNRNIPPNTKPDTKTKGFNP